MPSRHQPRRHTSAQAVSARENLPDSHSNPWGPFLVRRTVLQRHRYPPVTAARQGKGGIPLRLRRGRTQLRPIGWGVGRRVCNPCDPFLSRNFVRKPRQDWRFRRFSTSRSVTKITEGDGGDEVPGDHRDSPLRRRMASVLDWARSLLFLSSDVDSEGRESRLARAAIVGAS